MSETIEPAYTATADPKRSAVRSVLIGDLVTLKDICKDMGWSLRTGYTFVEAHDIPCRRVLKRIRYYDLADVREALDRAKPTPRLGRKATLADLGLEDAA